MVYEQNWGAPSHMICPACITAAVAPQPAAGPFSGDVERRAVTYHILVSIFPLALRGTDSRFRGRFARGKRSQHGKTRPPLSGAAKAGRTLQRYILPTTTRHIPPPPKQSPHSPFASHTRQPVVPTLPLTTAGAPETGSITARRGSSTSATHLGQGTTPLTALTPARFGLNCPFRHPLFPLRSLRPLLPRPSAVTRLLLAVRGGAPFESA